ncbi:O-methyltransferase [Macleaya cordata]|uniref:O-methyltransferase n=1 Tax=Macleaya cordata TaxID=56857 RepID=A0A200QLL9_MACCD|nr:O-methyltransferase [Macleaya cordata]
MEIQLGDQEQEMKWQGQVWNHICGSVDTAVLKCSIELGIFDIIHNSGKPMITLSELSTSPSLVSVKTENLYRLLRYLAHMNLITINSVEGNETFSLTNIAKLLLRNQEKSLVDWALGIGDEILMAVWHELSSSCSTPADGPTACQKVHSMGCYDLTEKNPKLNQVINNAMASDTRLVMPAFVQGCHEVLNGISSLVDIGGGIGTAMSYVVKAFPHIKCTAFDLPHVVATAPQYPGVDLVGGNMFEFIPPADAVLLKFMLHNWEDEECVKLLKRCKEAIPGDRGKVIIIEIVLDQDEDENDDDDDNYELIRARLSLDLDMMLSSGGRERTKDEWRVLLIEMAGFSRHEIIPICAIQSVIVAYP